MLSKVFAEDCLKTLARIPNSCIDLVVTSPPYDDLKKYHGFSFDLESVASELYRVIVVGGVVVWIVNDATKRGSETGTSFRQALTFMETGFNLHDTMIWHKSNAFNFGTNYAYRQSFEYMFVFSKGKPKTTNFIFDLPTAMNGKLAKGARRHPDGTRNHLKDFTVGEFKKRDNVWSIPTNTGKISQHPATFPLALVMDHITTWSNPGEVIYDPFLGSGTTAMAAKRLGREWIGSEISKDYAKLARRHIKAGQQRGL